MRELPADAPGRMRYEQYLEVAQLQMRSDRRGFSGSVAQAHYKLIGEATRALHPGALIFGGYLLNDHPEVVLDRHAYIDVLSIQPGSDRFEADNFDALYAKYGKPILVRPSM